MASASHTEITNLRVKQIFDVVSDFESYPKFVTGVSKCKLLSDSDTSAEVNMQTEMIKTIDYTIDVKKDFSDSVAKLSWTLKESDIFKVNNGQWILTSLPSGQTQVDYSLDVEFKVSVPGFMLKGLIKKTLPKAVSDFLNEAQKR